MVEQSPDINDGSEEKKSMPRPPSPAMLIKQDTEDAKLLCLAVIACGVTVVALSNIRSARFARKVFKLNQKNIKATRKILEECWQRNDYYNYTHIPDVGVYDYVAKKFIS